MNHAERFDAYPELLDWKPASGHPGGWRVVKYASPLECHLVELLDKAGRRRLFRSMGAAKNVADALNGADKPEGVALELNVLTGCNRR
jgi:hypothetical protein